MSEATLPGGCRYGWIHRLRGKLLIPPLLFALLCTRWQTEQEWVVFGLGGALFATGLLLRVWAQMHLHFRLADPTVLTTTGPYARVRNPIYIGNTLIVVGLCVGGRLLWSAPLALVWCGLLYWLVVRCEESWLPRRYGAPYLEYCENVPRFVPRLRPAEGVPSADARRFLLPSIRVELLRNLLLWAPFVLKELVAHR